MQVKFICRASQIGAIMTNARSKNEILGQTAKTYCENWLKEHLYNRKKEFSNKYTEKGIAVEDKSIEFISDKLGIMMLKNEQYFENDFISGTPDLITNDLVIDVKNSFDPFTFPLFNSVIPNKDYYYQLQGYMALTGKNKAKLIYTLMDTPEHIIERECNYYCRSNDLDELELYESFKNKMTYSDVEEKYRIKIFDIERDDKIIEEINQRVLDCRYYINSLEI